VRGAPVQFLPFLSSIHPNLLFSSLQPIRLLAAVLAKNAVGDSPRKLVQTREWARTPAEERASIRARLPGALVSELSPRVGRTLALLLANVARFDVPGAWPGLVADLAVAGSAGPSSGWPGGEAASSTPPLDPPAAAAAAGARTALLALKRVLAALATRRLVVDAPPPGPDGLMDMGAVNARVAAARAAQAEAVGSAVAPLRTAWEGHTRALLAAASAALAGGEFGSSPPALPPAWSPATDPALVRGSLAAAALHALREAAAALPDWAAAGPGAAAELAALAGELLGAGSALGEALTAARTARAAGAPSPLPPRAAALAASLARCAERCVQVATAMLDRAPACFGPHLPAFLPAYGAALLGLGRAEADSGGGGSGGRGGNLGGAGPDGGGEDGEDAPPPPSPLAPRPKTRVALTRFLARALVCPTYRQEWLDGAARAARTPAARAKAEGVRSAAAPAAAALDALAAGPGIGPTLAALVEGCIALTPAEAAAWAADPEGYAAGADAEASPDADAPRPCALALVSCLIDRGGGPAAQALLDLAGSLQGAPPGDSRATLLREATYRALGECLGQPDLAERLDFGAWWGSELRGLLVGGGGAPPPGLDNTSTSDAASLFAHRALVARAAWLAGVGAARLPAAPGEGGGAWGDALRGLVSLLPSADLVVSLAAATALHAALTDAIEEAAAAAGGGGGGPLRTSEEEEDAAAAEVDARAAAAAAAAVPAVTGLLTSILPRIGDDELAARLLGATAALFELCGRGASPALAPLAAALPAVWARAAAGAAGRPGGAARLHACLLSVLTHVLRRLGPAAAADPALCSVLWPALDAALDPAHPEADALAEDGLRLCGAALGAAGRVHIAAAAAAGGGGAAPAGAPAEDALPPPLRALLPRLAAIVAPARAGTGGPERRAAFGLLEAAVLIGGCGCLGPATAASAAAAVAGAVSHSLSAAAAMLEADRAAAREEAGGGDGMEEAGDGGGPPLPGGAPPPPPPPPPPRRGASSSAGAASAARAAARARRAADGVDATRDALAALGLASAMLLTDGPAAASALRPAAAACVAALAPPPGAPRPPAALADAASGVLARVVLASPPGVSGELLASDGSGGARALDGWLRTAGGRTLEEVVGLPAARALGRARRGGAAAALTSLVLSTQPPVPALVADPRRAARLVGLAASAADEAPAMAADVSDLETAAAAAAAASAAWAAGAPPPPGSTGPDGLGGDGDDAVFAARVGRAATDPLRRVDAGGNLRAVIAALAGALPGGGAALLQAAEEVGGRGSLAARVRDGLLGMGEGGGVGGMM